jgi:hypothetical protein
MQRYSNRSKSVIKEKYAGQYNPFSYSDKTTEAQSVFNFDGLNKSGSISRGISFGNNQDVIVNSGLNLQLSGTLSDRVEILAAITDNNIPIQPEGNTQQLQEFDKVFVQLSRDSTRLIAGDFEISRPPGYFLNLFKKAQGVQLSTAFYVDDKNKWLLRTTDAAALSKGKFARNTFNGTEANQGPYRLTGSENETYIIILSGSENIYLNGVLLKRGKDNDYIIDYNTAQITFTSKRLITKDSRIVAEFQYSDKNYVRTLLYSANSFENGKNRIRVNYFTEQDNKNQPLFQDLNDAKREVLANAGDNLQNAYFLNADSVGFNRNEVLYKMDTITIDGVFYSYYSYSTDSLNAYYRLGFTRLGQGKGNYRLLNSNVNGKVYEWIAPINGVPQGEYEPVRLLVAPRRQQLLTAGTDFFISKQTSVFMEGAFSKQDINLFSKQDKGNDKGFAVSAGIQNTLLLNWKDTSWKWTNSIMTEFTNKNFKPVENYREVEFLRDWNLTSVYDSLNESMIAYKTVLENNKMQSLSYQLKYFARGNVYKGMMHLVGIRYTIQPYFLNANGSVLKSSSNGLNTVFFRTNADAGRKWKGIKAGYRQENERNSIYSAQTDSLQKNSFGFDKSGFYLNSADSGKWLYRSELSRRWDYLPDKNNLALNTTADQADAEISFIPGRGRKITLGTTYRTLKVNRKELSDQKKDESLLCRADATFQLLKGGISTSTYYEVGTGQEQKQTYSYIKVAAGTGVFEWNDYNGNGIQELNEFEIAGFADRAEYIKVFTPTNDFVRIQTNQFSEVVSVNPSAFIKGKTSFNKIVNRFALQSALRFDNKFLFEGVVKGLNPFGYSFNDTALLSTNSSLRNTLFFNRTSSLFAADINYDNSRNKVLLANGTEGRNSSSWVINTRSYFKKMYGVTLALRRGLKDNNSVFSNRNYSILSYETEPRLSIQPGTVFRSTFIYKYQNKRNIGGVTNEKTAINTLGLELKYSSFKNGVASFNINLINIDYKSDINTPLAFEMLEGLKPGRNLTWEVGLQKNLSGNLQINVGYNGRKPQGEKTIHTANVQARAVF